MSDIENNEQTEQVEPTIEATTTEAEKPTAPVKAKRGRNAASADAPAVTEAGDVGESDKNPDESEYIAELADAPVDGLGSGVWPASDGFGSVPMPSPPAGSTIADDIESPAVTSSVGPTVQDYLDAQAEYFARPQHRHF